MRGGELIEQLALHVRSGQAVRLLFDLPLHQLAQLVEDVVAGLVREGGLDLVRALDGVAQVEPEQLLLVLDDGLGVVAALHLVERHGGVDPLVLTVAGEEGADEQGTQDHEDDPEQRPADETGSIHAACLVPGGPRRLPI